MKIIAWGPLSLAWACWAGTVVLPLFRPEILFTSFDYQSGSQVAERATKKEIFNDLADLQLTEAQIKVLMRDCPRYVLGKLEELGYNTAGVAEFYSHDYPKTRFGPRPVTPYSKLCIVLCSVEKAKFQGKDAWVFLFNWEYGPPAPGKTMRLAHFRIYVVDDLTGKVLHTSGCL